MRKHSARKWLHFVLDLLPILVLPIFAIYEINHDNNEPITVIDGAWEHREMYQTNDVNTLDDLIVGNIYRLTIENDTIDTLLIHNQYMMVQPLQVYSYDFDNYSFELDDYISSFTGVGKPEIKIDFECNGLSAIETYLMGLENEYISYIYIGDLAYSQFSFDADVLLCEFNGTNTGILSCFSASSYQEYEYIYNENHVYDNTDIGSQMLYALYKPVKDYFNFNNVFNFGDIYHWFELNMFGGNAPMPIFIVWNIIVYQFLIDLMFLVYSIFMFIIDFTSECLERCFSFSRHGGSR